MGFFWWVEEGFFGNSFGTVKSFPVEPTVEPSSNPLCFPSQDEIMHTVAEL